MKALKKMFTWPLKNTSSPRAIRSGALQIHDLVLAGATFSDDSNVLVDAFLRKHPLTQVLEQGALYPKFYDTNPKTLSLLEILITTQKPQIIVETGVANGASTRTILNALDHERTPRARLYSCDIDERVATLELNENRQFEFVLIKSREDFSNLVNRLERIDFFYHDSDHSYDHQLFEYLTVWEKLSAGGVLLSDDINWSYAFLDFCDSVGRRPWILSDTQKYSGFIQK
jgi:predicted O-methyltransferase YrrM